MRAFAPVLRRSIATGALAGSSRLTTPAETVEIRIAKTPSEREAIYRFRYAIYVEEMNRKQLHADHARRRIEDPLDAGAINLAAFRGRDVVGVCRINRSIDSDIGYYESFYEMSSVGGDHPQYTSITTRLMVAREFRNRRLAVRLAIASYEYCAPGGIRWNFIDCNDHLVAFFAGLGYVQHVPKAEHEEYGLVTRMRLEVRNLEHLGAVRSPFEGVLRRLLSAEVQPRTVGATARFAESSRRQS